MVDYLVRRWKVLQRYVLGGIVFLSIIFLASCSNSSYTEFSSYNDNDSIKDQLIGEPSREEIVNQLENNAAPTLEGIIGNTFTFIESVSGDQSVSNVYATSELDVQELAELLVHTTNPEEVSDYIDQQQILIYPDHFVFIKDSEVDVDVTIIEVATDEFVRNNYSPNFLSTYFTIRLIDSMLGADDWSRNRSRYCRTNDCYGGYTTNRGGPTKQRGMGSFRGGGPSAGK